MTKAELVVAMAKSTGSTKASAERAIDAFLAAVRDSLRRGHRVTISGFGTFQVARRQARMTINPRTGNSMRIPPARVPRFKPSKSLKSAIR
ncbi:MAG: HU family DNA-binding protein [Candidatus Rokubacteria bacterium]|nr:HU family DNA-binding protein [Candidatus Rokubacteria bacterium]